MRLANLVVSAMIIPVVALAPLSLKVQGASMQKELQLATSAFAPGSAIPPQYTCSGADQSPELHWGNPSWHGTLPAGTVTFALIVDDPDAPSGTWVHWTAWNIPASAHGLAESFPRQAERPDGTRQGRNDFGKIGYNGPCPPPGKTHRYFFRLYAVDRKLDLPAGATRSELDSALRGHVLAEAEYMGTYRR